ncbi:MAG: Ig-like domain-containing protein, partial [Sporichthyaceae bacterium]|nr:Ig-like domain-containing protein [Sporichthyaceae bacterium]
MSLDDLRHADAPPGPRRRPPLALTLIVLVVLVVAGIGFAAWKLSGETLRGAVADVTGIRGTPATQPPPPVRLSLSPADGARGVALSARAKVTADDGEIRSVSVTAANGKPLDGALSADARTWTSRGLLAPGTSYKVTVTAVNGAGIPAQRSSSFTTVTPKAVLRTAIMPLDGETVGVGMPIAIWFSQP